MAVVALVLSPACDDSAPADNDCDGDPSCETCPAAGLPCSPGSAAGLSGDWARFCAVSSGGTRCINVCKDRVPDRRLAACNVTLDCARGFCVLGRCYDAPHTGADDDPCEYDGDCSDGLVCDNDRVAASSCRCVVPCDVAPPQVGPFIDLSAELDEEAWGETDPDETWNVTRACCETDGTITASDYTIVLFHDATDRSFVHGDFASLEGGQRITGRFCGAELAWEGSDDRGEIEEHGTWSFPVASELFGTSTITATGVAARPCTYAGRWAQPPPRPADPTCSP